VSTIQGPLGQRPAGPVPQGALSVESTPLSEGEILTGRVLQAAGERSYLARLQGRTLLLKSDLPLRPGQALTVRVGQGKAGLELEVLKIEGGRQTESASPAPPSALSAPIESSVAAVLQRALSTGETLGGRVTALSDQIAQLLNSPQGRSLPSDILQALRAIKLPILSAAGGEVAAELMQLISALGLNLEADLAKLLGRGVRKLEEGNLDSLGLKWKVMRLISVLESSDVDAESSALLKEIIQEARGLLKSLEQIQAQNARFSNASYLFLELPFAPIEGFERARLEIFYKKRNDGKEIDPDNCSVAFTLDMSRLGRVRVWLAVRDGRVSGTIETKDGKTADFLRAETESLDEALEAQGYEAAGFQVAEKSVASEPVPTLLAESATSRLNVEA